MIGMPVVKLGLLGILLESFSRLLQASVNHRNLFMKQNDMLEPLSTDWHYIHI